ncbi:hypothetical protein HDE68_000853 [Pedobacter cryoconitis]|uniref:DUF4184 family protein n=1 Tax=Pedobacter cryoconitis TaxID=188932 RepID=A0A7W8ZJ88_9SPHI|nr:DUF4184 family protein [Pedobacter cryoconitis]MBB5634968.1 hypothetical protein [Pedobacter cryoconitis]
MPFTLAHPAIIMPLCRYKTRFISVTGLIVGSMVPDFEFFLKMKTGPNIGHHFWGIFIFDLPVALIICFVYHNLLRDTFFAHLPNWFRIRFNRYAEFKWNTYALSNKLVLITSILVGIFSHFIWDAFTHDDGFFVQQHPFFNNQISVSNHDVPVYQMLQVFFSFWGLWIMCRVIADMPQHPQNFEDLYQSNLKYWFYISLVGLLILTIRLVLLPEYISFWDVFMACMGSGIYAWCLVSLFYIKTQTTKSLVK